MHKEFLTLLFIVLAHIKCVCICIIINLKDFFRLLKAAEEYHLPKSLKDAKGGGLKEFTGQEVQNFEGSDNEQGFFTSEERQWLVLRLLESIRAKPSDVTAASGFNLLEGQAISV